MMRAFGLTNTGSICYFNSLVQGLLSCPLFVNKFKNNCDSDVAIMITTFLQSLENNNAAVLTVVPILKQLANGHVFFGNQQEDVTEGFDLLIDKMGPAIELAFVSKWRVDIYCDACKQMVSSSTDVMNRLIMEQSFIPLCGEGDQFAAYMSANMSEFNDYRCGTCKAPGVRGMRVARLMEPPSIYIISFNKFMGKWGVKYPEEVRVTYGFKQADVAIYRLVAVIRHFGSMGGGHYNATVMREDGVYSVDDTKIVKMPFIASDNDYVLMFIRV
jgi:ubiquitin C-terminal hydrolase